MPLLVLTIGLFLVVINAFMLQLTAWLSGKLDLGFHVDGFLTAVGGAIVITIVTWGVTPADRPVIPAPPRARPAATASPSSASATSAAPRWPHVVLESRLDDAGLGDRVEVTSSGTGGWHVGNPMDPRAAATLTQAGYDATRHRARQYDASWADRNDLVPGHGP